MVIFVVDITDVEEDLLPVGVLGNSKQGVGSLALIVPLEATAQSHRSYGVRLIFVNRPPSHIELMGTLIVQIAVATFPAPRQNLWGSF